MKFIVKDTHIRHGGDTFGPGAVIELTEKEALSIAHHLEPIVEGTEPPDDGVEGDTVRKGRRK